MKLNEFMKFMNRDDSINLSILEDSSSSSSSNTPNCNSNTPNCNSIVLICVILSIILFVIFCICVYLWRKQIAVNKRNLVKKDDEYILNNDGTVYWE